MSAKNESRLRRARRARSRMRGLGVNRLSVHRTPRHIYAQIIDDIQGTTLAAASSLDKTLRKTLTSTGGIEAAKAVGKLIADRAKAAKVTAVVFDRGGRMYHGRIKALADASREGGLKF